MGRWLCFIVRHKPPREKLHGFHGWSLHLFRRAVDHGVCLVMVFVMLYVSLMMYGSSKQIQTNQTNVPTSTTNRDTLSPSYWWLNRKNVSKVKAAFSIRRCVNRHHETHTHTHTIQHITKPHTLYIFFFFFRINPQTEKLFVKLSECLSVLNEKEMLLEINRITQQTVSVVC